MKNKLVIGFKIMRWKILTNKSPLPTRFFIILFVGLLNACNNNYDFRPISDFKIDTTIRNIDSVKVLHCSGGPANDKDIDYYYHLIVVSDSTHDTLNLLTPIITGIENDSESWCLIIQKSLEYSLYQDLFLNEKQGLKELSKVITNTTFKDIEYNHYPSVICILGKQKK